MHKLKRLKNCSTSKILAEQKTAKNDEASAKDIQMKEAMLATYQAQLAELLKTIFRIGICLKIPVWQTLYVRVTCKAKILHPLKSSLDTIRKKLYLQKNL